MDIHVKDYCFREMTNISSHLAYISRGNVFTVTFNIHNRPHISITLKTIGAQAIPKDILEEFYWQIWQRYPAGFHTRNSKNSSWISGRFSELFAGSSFKIDEPLDPSGGMTINDTYLDAYVITLSLLDNSIGVWPQDCIIAANMKKRKIYLFRYFAEAADFGNYKPSQILRIYPPGKLARIGVDKKHHLVFFDAIVAATVYTYNEDNTLILFETAVRNDKIGNGIVSTLGDFIITSRYKYSE